MGSRGDDVDDDDDVVDDVDDVKDDEVIVPDVPFLIIIVVIGLFSLCLFGVVFSKCIRSPSRSCANVTYEEFLTGAEARGSFTIVETRSHNIARSGTFEGRDDAIVLFIKLIADEKEV